MSDIVALLSVAVVPVSGVVSRLLGLTPALHATLFSELVQLTARINFKHEVETKLH